MSERTSDRRLSLWEKFKDKVYRDGFVASHLASNIAAQIFSTRELRGWTQQELADQAGMAQARISVMEDSGYEAFSVKTLKRLASALDVALVIRFVPFSELADYAINMTSDEIAVREFKNDALAPNQDQLVQINRDYFDLATLPVGQPVIPGFSGQQFSATGHVENVLSYPYTPLSTSVLMGDIQWPNQLVSFDRAIAAVSVEEFLESLDASDQWSVSAVSKIDAEDVVDG